MDTTQNPNADVSTSGFHPINIGHFVMGIAFTGLLVIWALVVTDTADSADLRWLAPMPWLLAGLGGVIAAVLAPRRRAAAVRSAQAAQAAQTARSTSDQSALSDEELTEVLRDSER